MELARSQGLIGKRVGGVLVTEGNAAQPLQLPVGVLVDEAAAEAAAAQGCGRVVAPGTAARM